MRIGLYSLTNWNLVEVVGLCDSYSKENMWHIHPYLNVGIHMSKLILNYKQRCRLEIFYERMRN